MWNKSNTSLRTPPFLHYLKLSFLSDIFATFFNDFKIKVFVFFDSSINFCIKIVSSCKKTQAKSAVNGKTKKHLPKSSAFELHFAQVNGSE